MKKLFPKIFSLRSFSLLLLLGSFLILGAVLQISFQRTLNRVPGGISLTGRWGIEAAPISLSEATIKKNWPITVNVPEPLPQSLRENIKNTYWIHYRFSSDELSQARAKFKSVALYLGVVKGKHEVYWNGKFLGAEGDLEPSDHHIPQDFLHESEVDLLVRLEPYASPYMGIVHSYPVSLGEGTGVEAVRLLFYFEQGVKPLLLAAFKYGLFFLFLLFFVSVPLHKEYFYFALYSFFSASIFLLSSRFFPVYENYYLRNFYIYLFSALSLACVLPMTLAFLRMKAQVMAKAAIYSAFVVGVFLFAVPLVSTSDKRLELYRMANFILPILLFTPAVLLSGYWCYVIYREKTLLHRAVQILFYLIFLSFGEALWLTQSFGINRFQTHFRPEYLDLCLFAGLAISMILDFRFASVNFRKAENAIPIWFKGFLNLGVETMRLEIPMLVVAVDAAGYTERLSKLSSEEKSTFHSAIRRAIDEPVLEFAAVKLSDRGDGAIFAWELKTGRLEQEMVAARVRDCILALGSSSYEHLQFRIGVAAGSVQCGYQRGEVSYLGEPLNFASRLEALAAPGDPLVHESAVKILKPNSAEANWVSWDVKGVNIRATNFKEAA